MIVGVILMEAMGTHFSTPINSMSKMRVSFGGLDPDGVPAPTT